MRRLPLTFTLLLVVAATGGGFHEWATPAHGATASCGDTFPADGFAGPHWNSNNGGTMFGNTVKISCPGASTPWDVTYRVQGAPDGTSAWANVFSVHKTGNGSIQFSLSSNPVGCNPNGIKYRTHVDNNVTGGNANKPSGGSGVHLTC